MVNKMDTLDEEKRLKILKYGKYGILLIIIVIAFLIIRSCGRSYGDIISEIKELTGKYIAMRSININQEIYIELSELGEVEGTELCSKASGVIVNNQNGSLRYQVYLQCPNYVSDVVDNDNDYIELNGAEVIILNSGEVYKELGYVNKKGAIIEEEANIKPAVGIYTVYYKAYVDDVLKETATRKVIVSKSDKTANISGITDINYPTIVLNGDSKITILKNNQYKEPGYKAIDYTDGKISRKVITDDNIDSSKEGTYFKKYSVTNSKGNKTEVVREVNVVTAKANLNISLTTNNNLLNNQVQINLNITGEGYSYSILPDGSRNNYKNINYDAKSNKTYQFKIYDIYNNEYVKEIEIDTIDSIPPSGSCIATIYAKSVSIVVNANDNKGISGYNYYLDNDSSSYINESTYNFQRNTTKNNIPKVKVEIKDIASNVTTISCTNALELTPTVYKDINGYDCLEPYICYKQKDYSDPYRATSNGVGTIYRSGCLPTSLTIISTKFGKKSIDGNFYTPPTLIKEVIYPDGKIVGYSNYTRTQEVAKALGLKVSEPYRFNNANLEIFKSHLKNGNPALILITNGCYSTGAHYMAVLGMNETGQVFLSDPYMRENKSMTGKCKVNTWVDISEMLSKGSVENFVLFNE